MTHIFYNKAHTFLQKSFAWICIKSLSDHLEVALEDFND